MTQEPDPEVLGEDVADTPEAQPAARTRRDVLAGGLAVGSGLLAVGTAASHGVQYLVPQRATRTREVFITHADAVPEGSTLEITLPTGARVQIKQVDGKFAGFSDVCPHLGCRVSWQAARDGETDPDRRDGYFRCPCHEGLFRADGSAFSGPPADAGQSLKRVPLTQVGNALYLRFEETLS